MVHADKSPAGRLPASMGIAAFLKARRAALDPADAGLPTAPNRRRVPGLRREEVAQLAGISVDYYVRIEQDRAQGISDSVLDGLARALRLSPDEHSHLRNLAAPRFRSGQARTPLVRPEILRLLDAMDDTVPAFIYGPGLDYLAWNRLGGRMAFDLGAVPEHERNAVRLVFLHPDARALHPDWDQLAAQTVAALRAETGRYPCHPRVKGVVAELLDRSPEFRALWQEQEVQGKFSGFKRIQNPLVGELVVTYETFHLATDEQLVLCTFTAEPDSPSEQGLRRLAALPLSPTGR